MFPSEKSANLGLRSNSATGIPIPSHWVVSSGPCSQALVPWLPHKVCFLAMQYLALDLQLPESRMGKVEAKRYCLPHTLPG